MTLRPLKRTDLAAVKGLLPSWAWDAAGQKSKLDAMAACDRLLAEGSMTGVVLTADEARGTPVGVAAVVFVPDEYVAAQKTGGLPGLAERILQSALGPSSPALRPDAIERASDGDGLNLVVLFHAWEKAGTDEELGRAIRISLAQAFLDDFRGYHLREVISEGDEEDVRWARAGNSFLLRDSYEAWYQAHDEPVPRRALLGITGPEALAIESSVTALLFRSYRPPVYRFSRPERRLLQCALVGETDVEIAALLGVSVSTVKKRWAAIFNRVSDLKPKTLASTDSRWRNARRELTRGPQKRHTLLAYLREHLEELRP